MGKTKDMDETKKKTGIVNLKLTLFPFFGDYSKEIGNSKLLLRVIPNEEGTIPNIE